MLYKYSEKFRGFKSGLGEFFGRLPITPNCWTALSLIAAFMGFYLIIQDKFISGAALFAIAAFLDLIDGSVAKAKNKVSVLGAYLDTITDRYVEFIIIFGLFFVAYPHFIFSAKTWLLIMLFGSLMTSYSISAAREEGVEERRLRGGILERGERMILLFLIILLSDFSRTYALYLIAIMAVLANITALQRIWIAVRIFAKERRYKEYLLKI
ncbi:MAG: CDP-alcohol phosphatidyltransferase family protein [Nanoarchaeota archaeon]|nr:CDP-alcohol phosphatidyltransferase family protein [Nanoarchaeota archaeon]